MWLSLDWIKDFVDFEPDRSPGELGVLLSLKVAEVEDVKTPGEYLSQVRVVEVMKTEKHPGADRLSLATVTDGREERTLVCGAPNCRPGIKVPFADIGARLLGKDKKGQSVDFEIRKTRIRGIESVGMLCSKAELGLEENSDGVWELDSDAPVGAEVSGLDSMSGLNDILFEIENKSLTHRPDLWGHYGFAREFSAIYEVPLKPYPGIDIGDNSESTFSVKNHTPALCRRYSALEIRNVKIEPSPEWMRRRLETAGLKPINNIVDITNYILLELGQPMHAFDVEKLGNRVITVRTAEPGEKFTALDENGYELTEEDIVIDSNGEAVALAGIMGGLGSGIEDSTRHILLESANFAAATVRRTSNRLALRSDSSIRFEKSLDPENTGLSLKRAAQLILELCPEAELVGGIVESYDNPYHKLEVDTSVSFIRKLLGTDDVSAEFIKKKLDLLGFKNEGDLKVSVPSWRTTKDIEYPEDIVEEIGRMYGFDNIEPRTPFLEVTAPALPNAARSLERDMKNALVNGFGFTEIMLYPWTGAKQLSEYSLDPEGLMTLRNAVSEDSRYMRAETVPHLVDSIAENLKYFDGFRLFEFGRVYDTSAMDGLLPEEKFKLSGAIVPEYRKGDLQTDAFYECKALVLDLLKIAGIRNVKTRPLAGKSRELPSWVHPGIAAQLCRGNRILGEIFKLHPVLAGKKDIRNNVYIFVLHFDKIEDCERKFSYRPVARYPGVPFDVTILAKEKTLAADIRKLITGAAGKLIRDIEVFSIYRADDLGREMKAVSFRMIFGADDHTLAPEEITEVQDKVVNALESGGFSLKHRVESTEVV